MNRHHVFLCINGVSAEVLPRRPRKSTRLARHEEFACSTSRISSTCRIDTTQGCAPCTAGDNNRAFIAMLLVRDYSDHDDLYEMGRTSDELAKLDSGRSESKIQ
jgi:hypothetical protein